MCAPMLAPIVYISRGDGVWVIAMDLKTNHCDDVLAAFGLTNRD